MQVISAAEGSSGPNVLGLLVTSKCNIICRHCCNDSHPKQQGSVRFENLALLVEMAGEIPSIKEVGISGGEPFLFLPLLKRLIEFAKSRGLTSAVTTNGFWATSKDRAVALLSELKACGLGTISISTSVFHQEFIDLLTVVTAARSAIEVGVVAKVNYVSTASVSLDELRIALGDLSNKVEIVVMPCIATGRGARNVSEKELPRTLAAPHGNCREHFKKLAVDALGNVYPCCSPGGFTEPLLMGNANVSSLRSVIDRSASNKLLAILEAVGPQFFLPFLQAAAVPGLPERFSDQCDLCNTMLSSERYLPIVRNAAEQLFSELATLSPGARSVTSDRISRLVELSETAHLPASLEESTCRISVE